jgi:hypothetical protein
MRCAVLLIHRMLVMVPDALLLRDEQGTPAGCGLMDATKDVVIIGDGTAIMQEADQKVSPHGW